MSNTTQSCPHCNTPLIHAHQREAHREQPCKAILLARIKELEEENSELKQTCEYYKALSKQVNIYLKNAQD